jgi:AcrR family transcriptional regulator
LRAIEKELPGEARDQRRRLIAAMVDSCAEKTYAGTTIADVVALARVSRTTFYREFGDKRACFDAAIAACVEELQEFCGAAYSPGDPPARAVRRAVAAFLGRLAERPQMAALLTGEAVAVEPAVVERYRDAVLPPLAALWRQDGAGGRPHTDPRLAFGRAELLLFDAVASGRSGRLGELLPELVYLAVAPYAGHEEALAEARRAGAKPVGGEAG